MRSTRDRTGSRPERAGRWPGGGPTASAAGLTVFPGPPQAASTADNLFTRYGFAIGFLMVFLGVVVGGIVISMYMPMFKLIQVLSGG